MLSRAASWNGWAAFANHYWRWGLGSSLVGSTTFDGVFNDYMVLSRISEEDGMRSEVLYHELRCSDWADRADKGLLAVTDLEKEMSTRSDSFHQEAKNKWQEHQNTRASKAQDPNKSEKVQESAGRKDQGGKGQKWKHGTAMDTKALRKPQGQGRV